MDSFFTQLKAPIHSIVLVYLVHRSKITSPMGA
jgi:hypothetical protein